MSMQMSQPPPPPPSGPPANNLFPDELIMQISQETGFPPERVKADIERTGAQTKEDLYPQFYSAQGIEPPQGETVAPGMAQGQPPNTSPNAMPPTDGDYAINRQAGMPPTAMAPPEAGEQSVQPPQSEAAEGIDPAVMQQLHAMMRPKKR